MSEREREGEHEIEAVSGDDDALETYLLPVKTLFLHMPRSELYQNHKRHDVIRYRPLTKINERDWLIDVGSRVYAVPEDMLLKGIEEIERVNQS